MNHFYKDVVISDNWEDVSNETDPELWNRLTDVDNHDSNNSESDTDNEDGNHDDYEENQRCGNILPTFMHSMDGATVLSYQVLEIAPGEGKIHLYLSQIGKLLRMQSIFQLVRVILTRKENEKYLQ